MKRLTSLTLVFLLFTTLAWAKPPVRATTPLARYKQGLQQIEAADYEAAAASIEAAYAAKPTSAWLFDLGRAYELGKHPQKALETYRRYLAENPDAPNRNETLASVNELEEELRPPPAPKPVPRAAPSPAAATDDGTVAPVAVAKPTRTTWHGTPKTPYELGVRVRYLAVSNLMLKPYLDAATQMTRGASVGAEFVYHRKTFDVVLSLDYSYFGVDDGNYLGRGNDPSQETNYLQFRKLGMLSVDVAIIGHHTFNKYFQLRGGAGLGVGAVFGNVLDTSSSTACTKQNANNPALCHPNVPGWDANNPEPSLKASERAGVTDDTPSNPSRHKSKSKPPAMGVLNLMIAARFFLPQKFTLEVELGFRDAMFVGINAHHRF